MASEACRSVHVVLLFSGVFRVSLRAIGLHSRTASELRPNLGGFQKTESSSRAAAIEDPT